MSFHSKRTGEFVGLRMRIGGRRQVVYDALTGKRVILEVRGRDASDEDINAALEEAVSSPNVLAGVLSALKARNIDVDYSN